jgi:two-component sensor histidine kinase
MNAMVSLLGLKAKSIKDTVSKNILYETSGRIRSMAILYDKLYRSNNYQEINIQEYLNPL